MESDAADSEYTHVYYSFDLFHHEKEKPLDHTICATTAATNLSSDACSTGESGEEMFMSSTSKSFYPTEIELHNQTPFIDHHATLVLSRTSLSQRLLTAMKQHLLDKYYNYGLIEKMVIEMKYPFIWAVLLSQPSAAKARFCPHILCDESMVMDLRSPCVLNFVNNSEENGKMVRVTPLHYAQIKGFVPWCTAFKMFLDDPSGYTEFMRNKFREFSLV